MTMNPFYDRVSFVLTWEGTRAGPPACQRSRLLLFVHCSSEPFIKFLGWNFCTRKVSYEIYKYLHTYVHEAINARAINTRQGHLCERNIGCAPSRCGGDARRVRLRLRQSPPSGASCCQVLVVLFLTSRRGASSVWNCSHAVLRTLQTSYRWLLNVKRRHLLVNVTRNITKA